MGEIGQKQSKIVKNGWNLPKTSEQFWIGLNQAKMAKIGLKWQTKVQTDQDKRPDEDYWCQASGASGREEQGGW